MKKKYINTGKVLLPIGLILLILIAFEMLVDFGIISNRVLPPPTTIVKTLIHELPLMSAYILYTLRLALTGFLIAFLLALVLAIVMDNVPLVEKAIYPILLITQTIPTIALAPILVLWFGYGEAPKLILIVSVCFFPIAINLLDGLKSADKDLLKMLKSMGAGKLKRFWLAKLPSSMGGMFSGLKIAATYCIMGSVVAEWLGGAKGIGVYMIRVKKSYSYDKMFASIIVVIVLSLLLTQLMVMLRKIIIKWEKETN